MFSDPQLKSKQWFQDIRESKRDNADMDVINPYSYVNGAVSEITLLGDTISDEDYLELFCGISDEEIIDGIEKFSFDMARTVVSIGK